MSTSAIATSLEKLVKNSANQLGNLQVGVNKILWGNGNTQPIQTVEFKPAANGATGSLNYSSNIPTTPQPPKVTLVESGLFNALDALNQVDLCQVITYATNTITAKAKTRSTNPSALEANLYLLQDQAAVVVNMIDKYTANPNVLINSFVLSSLNQLTPSGPTGAYQLPSNTVTQQQAASQAGIVNQTTAAQAGASTGVTNIQGTDVKKYNTYFLLQGIKDTFSFDSNNSLFTAQDKTLITSVPGLGSNLNIIDNFLGIINKYSDYRQITDADLLSLERKIMTLRSVCVTIQNLDFISSLTLVGNFLNIDIRNQIQELSKYVNPTQIVPTIKQINAAIQSFIRIANQVYGILNTGQFLIKLALLFYKVFKFVIQFFGALPLPLVFVHSGAQTIIQNAKDSVKNEVDGLSRILKAVNALLAVTVIFIRYLLTNCNELSQRLQVLLANLEKCDAVKNSDVIAQLQQTASDLKGLQDKLATYIITYDSKVDPNTAIFGAYDIRVVDEEVTDTSIVNKRRRGIALDQYGEIVAQSDLTFATNTAVIIGEVKQRLIALNLVQPTLGVIDGANLDTISTALTYLENNDVIQDDLNLSTSDIDSPENADENKGLGLNAFVNNLKGGRALRKRTRAALNNATNTLRSQFAPEKTGSTNSLGSIGTSIGG